jgi:hypothetical protein
MTRTRVVNRNGTAVLQHTSDGNNTYKDAMIPPGELEKYLQQKKTGPAETGQRVDRMSDRRERRDRNGGDRESRDQDRYNNRNYNNNPESTGAIPRRQNSPPMRLSTPNSQPVLQKRLPAAAQPGGHIQPPQAQKPPQQQHSQQPHQHIMQQQGFNNNSEVAALQQWSQGTHPVNSHMQVNPMQGGFMQPIPPQMMAFLQQQMVAQQQYQQQLHYTTDNSSQHTPMQHTSHSNNNTREDY